LSFGPVGFGNKAVQLGTRLTAQETPPKIGATTHQSAQTPTYGIEQETQIKLE
jgi:hypothetical protein